MERLGVRAVSLLLLLENQLCPSNVYGQLATLRPCMHFEGIPAQQAIYLLSCQRGTFTDLAEVAKPAWLLFALGVYGYFWLRSVSVASSRWNFNDMIQVLYISSSNMGLESIISCSTVPPINVVRVIAVAKVSVLFRSGRILGFSCTEELRVTTPAHLAYVDVATAVKGALPVFVIVFPTYRIRQNFRVGKLSRFSRFFIQSRIFSRKFLLNKLPVFLLFRTRPHDTAIWRYLNILKC